MGLGVGGNAAIEGVDEDLGLFRGGKMVISDGEGRPKLEGEGGVIKVHHHVCGIPAGEYCGIVMLEGEIGCEVVRVGVRRGPSERQGTIEGVGVHWGQLGR